MGEPSRSPAAPRRVDLALAGSAETLVDALDTLIEQGVVLQGDLELGVAEVALVRARLRLYLRGVRGEMVASGGADLRSAAASTDGAVTRQVRERAGSARRSRAGESAPPASARVPTASTPDASRAPSPGDLMPRDPDRERDPSRGLAHLVVLLIDVLRRLMERQATRRVEAGELPDDRVEALGKTFIALEERMHELLELLDSGPARKPAPL
jgi:hypothetical protein